jgi:hypothetical protein
LSWAGCGISLGGVTSASLEVATLGWLRGCTVVELCAAATKGGVSGRFDFICSSQKIEPIAPTRTRAETLVVQTPERRPATKPSPFGSFEWESPDLGAPGGSTSGTLVSVGLHEGASTDG